jgi:hypothetical protein
MPEVKTDALALPSPEKIELKVEGQSTKLTRLAAFTPTNLSEAMALAKMIAQSDLAPKDYKGKPGNVLIAMQFGAELGVAPMQSVQNIAVINGRPSLWGDLALALVQKNPEYEWHKEYYKGEGEGKFAVCEIKRKGHELSVKTFSVADAKKAALWNKAGPWQQYPDRMLQMRARAFAIRDRFADALKGLSIGEEVMDMPSERTRDQGRLQVSELATVEAISQSDEPNRGHGNEGTQIRRAEDKKPEKPEKKEDVLCGECGVTNGHTPECKYADGKPPAVRKVLVQVTGKKSAGKCKLVLSCMDDMGDPVDIYVWHKTLQAELDNKLKQKENCVFEVSVNKKDGREFFSLEHILSIGAIEYENDSPKAVEVEQTNLDAESPDEEEASQEGSAPEALVNPFKEDKKGKK